MKEEKKEIIELWYKCSCGGKIIPEGKYKMDGRCKICGKKFQRAPLGDGLI